MSEERQRPAARGTLKALRDGKTRFINRCHRLAKDWCGLSKGQKYMSAAAVLLLVWTLVLQVQVLELSKTVALQQVRISQLEKQVKRQNNLLYSASVTLDDIEKKWHSLNFRVLENTWRIEEPKKNPDSM